VAFRGSPVSKFENSAISEVVSTTSLQEILPAQLALGMCSGSDYAPSRKGPNLQSFYGVITGQMHHDAWDGWGIMTEMALLHLLSRNGGTT
jgi:hypothetical protein